ncbi:hypothetical protein LZ30DRAFT_734232 [Colletotrichum cereale]|nr:hypothetical protein LZ30DRAFT_734232 [Colletotrichum cereale]
MSLSCPSLSSLALIRPTLLPVTWDITTAHFEPSSTDITKEAMKFLSTSRDEVRLHISSSGSPKVDKLTVGAAILRYDTSGPSVLLLKRNPDEKYYPNVFEIPGGKVDATDPTIRDAIVREVAEETRLTVLDVTASLSRMMYTTEKIETMPITGEDKIVKHRAL